MAEKHAKMTDYTGDMIDRLLTVEYRPYGLSQKSPGIREGYSRGTIANLYDAAKAKVGRPLTLYAAELIHKALEPGDIALISTGWVIPFWAPRGETDGPVGAVALARALHLGYNARTVFVTEEQVMPVMDAGVKAASLRSFELDFLKKNPNLGRLGGVSTRTFPLDVESAKEESKRILDELEPSFVLTTEKCGRNEKGVYHTGLGNDMSDVTIKVDYLVDEARRRSIPTIGIIDIGNEIGSGLIKDTVRQIIPWGEKCKCPCGGGIASVVETDAVIPASSCNFGAYGLTACLAGLKEDLKILHDPVTEKWIREECARAGAVDGGTLTGGGYHSIRGIDLEYNSIPTLKLLRTLVDIRQPKYSLDLFRP